jgi:hypothetical protein
MDHRNECIILTAMFIFWRKQKTLWGRVWANVSHCVYLTDAVGIMLYMGADGGAEFVVIQCGSTRCAKCVYQALASNAFRMGCPSKVISPDVLFRNSNVSLFYLFFFYYDCLFY